jgi:hypothetical protein
VSPKVSFSLGVPRERERESGVVWVGCSDYGLDRLHFFLLIVFSPPSRFTVDFQNAEYVTFPQLKSRK